MAKIESKYTLKMDADNKAFRAGVEGAEAEYKEATKNMGKAGEELAKNSKVNTKVIERAYRNLGVKNTESEIKRLQASFDLIKKSGVASAQEIAKAQEGLNRKIGQINKTAKDRTDGLKDQNNVFGRLKQSVLGYAAAFASVGAAIAVVKSSISAFAEAERQQLRLQAVLKATGGAAGLTAQQIEDFAVKLSEETLSNTQQVRDAAAALATIGGVTGDNFKRTLALAQDLTEAFGGSLISNVTRLGRAIDDPVESLTTLRRAAINFTDAEEEQLKVLKEAGDQLAITDIILGKVADKMGGAGRAAAQGLAGDIDTLGERWTIFQEKLGESELTAAAIKGLAGLIAGWTNFIELMSPKYTKTFGAGLQEFTIEAVDAEAAFNKLISKRIELQKVLDTAIIGRDGVKEALAEVEKELRGLQDAKIEQIKLDAQRAKEAKEAAIAAKEEAEQQRISAEASKVAAKEAKTLQEEKKRGLREIEQLEQQKTEAVKQLAKDEAQAKADAQNKVVNTAKQALDRIIQAEKKAQDDLKQVRENAAQSAASDEIALIEIKRRGMSETAQQADIEEEAAKRIREAKQALIDGDIEAAKVATDRAKQLAQQITDNDKAASTYKKAADVTKQAFTDEEAAAKKAADAQSSKRKQAEFDLKAQESAAKLLKAALDALAQPKTVKLDIDITEAKKKLAEIERKLRELGAGSVVGFATGGAVQGFATGGGVGGTGTGDTVPAMLTPGEHVLTRADVRAIGGQQAVYNLRRNLGNVPAQKSITGRYATGGEVSGGGQPIVINLPGGGRINATTQQSQRDILDIMKQEARAR